MFTLAISSLATFNLPWYMNLTFQVPMEYCCLQDWNLFPSPGTSTTGCCFCFGSVSSFFLELFLHWCLAYWAPTDLGTSSFSVISFCLFILFMGFSRQEYWSGLPFLSPVDHVLSELSTMNRLTWVAPHGMAHGFIESNKTAIQVINLVNEIMKSLSHVWLFVIPQTVAYQVPPSMGFSRQEYRSVFSFPSPGDLPNPGVEPRSPALQEDALPSEPPGKLSPRDQFD